MTDHLLIRLKARSMDPATCRQYASEIRELAIAKGHSRIVVVRDIPAPLSLTEYFESAKLCGEMLHGFRVAWVNPHPDNSEGLEFGITVANNRGALFRLFTSYAGAKAWFREESRSAKVRSSDGWNTAHMLAF
jgi:hypothetical protein